MSKREQGKQRIKTILGEKSEDIIKKFEVISPDFANYILEFGYGDLYSRKGFSDKNRELAAVSCLIGQGNTGLPLKAHLEGMLHVGWTKNEIIELLIFLVGYIGFPRCVEAMATLQHIEEPCLPQNLSSNASLGIAPQDILPDGVDQTSIGGKVVRKGTIAAFLANIDILENPSSSSEKKQAALKILKELAPDVNAIGLHKNVVFKNAQAEKILVDADSFKK